MSLVPALVTASAVTAFCAVAAILFRVGMPTTFHRTSTTLGLMAAAIALASVLSVAIRIGLVFPAGVVLIALEAGLRHHAATLDGAVRRGPGARR